MCLITPQIRLHRDGDRPAHGAGNGHGAMERSALYEAPFSSVHAGGPEALFAGKSNVIEGIFERLKALQPEPLADAG